MQGSAGFKDVTAAPDSKKALRKCLLLMTVMMMTTMFFVTIVERTPWNHFIFCTTLAGPDLGNSLFVIILMPAAPAQGLALQSKQ